MPALPARDVEDARAGGKRQDLEESGHLAPVAREIEDRLVFEQVVGVEVGLPPLAGRAGARQKKTGSRYAPKTSSSARRISKSVQ